MHIEPLILVGAGGHGKVVLDAALAGGTPLENVTVVDDNEALTGGAFLTTGISAGGSGSIGTAEFHLSIGNNAIRRTVQERVVRDGGRPRSIIHPTAVISSSASIAPGAFVAALALIGPDSRIGTGAIVNHGAIVDHDSEVGSFAHIAPGVTLCGGVAIGANVLVGAGAVILPGLTVGAGAVIGAGAVVVRNVPPGRTMIAGVAARDREGK